MENNNNLIKFFIEAGKLKRIPRRGWILRKIENPETIAEHVFRTTLMGWIIGKKNRLNPEKVIKMALVHDLCEVYSRDTTPYDTLISGKDKEEIQNLVYKWPGFTRKEKERQIKDKCGREERSLIKLTKDLSPEIREEIISLWEDYENGLSKEGRFVRQLDRIENLMQALEYWKKDKKFPIKPFWTQIKELIDDKELLDFIKDLDNYFN